MPFFMNRKRLPRSLSVLNPQFKKKFSSIVIFFCCCGVIVEFVFFSDIEKPLVALFVIGREKGEASLQAWLMQMFIKKAFSATFRNTGIGICGVIQ